MVLAAHRYCIGFDETLSERRISIPHERDMVVILFQGARVLRDRAQDHPSSC